MLKKKTKIVATLGPASFDPKVIRQLIEAGMNVARLNFSHGTHEQMDELITIVRGLSDELKIPIAILADLQGPKMRLGKFPGVVEIKTGDKVDLSISPKGNEFPIQFDLSRHVLEGQRIFLNDGLIELEVVEVEGQTIKTLAKNNGRISENKGINIPDTKLGVAAFTQKDQKDAVFALGRHVDYVALSYVETATDIAPLDALIKELSPKTKTMVKVERREAIANLERIIDSADAVMVARGDLATETSPSEIPIFQQKIIRLARQANKPVIVATQMLESMTENPRPTRAETSDVANAVFIQADAVMLSAESASGKYPVEAVKTMTDIITSVEEHPDFKQYIRISWDTLTGKNIDASAIASSAAALAYRIAAPLIGVATASGKTARLISSFRPQANIVALTHDDQTKNQLALVWGVTPLIVKPHSESDVFWDHVVKEIVKNDFVEQNSKVVLVGGSGNIGVSGATDTIKIIRV